ncbi:hypothetical protein LEP1GSC186_2068 [Leptospira noguchii serovar Autumnalis str. ZUN142]|uniref:Uncharacterized protein n=1 Tax=Leptospira noguchii serovar Autumnalis str. ZUN142 TaxID=1085540 RepID=M6U9R2_9LEPT|nr:hypothetical protein [Leptospira noguchii]EMO41757.1 hypothetical protein LEP1GSC186_2068 [Leptospira noguchii serovar Autumnalis str. ZUN142]UOG43637.1 hypothetical protein MAL01_09020 [Leptospira noguchii]
MERKELNETLFTKAFETQHNAFLWVGVQGVRCIEFIIRPNFLTSNSR